MRPPRPTITGGAFRGLRLEVPSGDRTRPTRGLVREALFSIVAARLPDARVLDLYAGSGALGLEALSRGARHATFWERDRHALAALERNLATCAVGPDRARLIRASVKTAPPDDLESLDLVLADPPYRLPAPLPGWLLEGRSCAPDAVLVVESTSRGPEPADLPAWSVARTRIYGETRLTAFERRTET